MRSAAYSSPSTSPRPSRRGRGSIRRWTSPLRALVNSAGVGVGPAHHRQGRRVPPGTRPRRLPEGARDQPGRHVRLHPTGKRGDEPSSRPPRANAGQTSVAASTVRPGQAAYSSSIGRRGRPDPSGGTRDLLPGIRVNTVAPGLSTPRSTVRARPPRRSRPSSASRCCSLHRLGKPEELASMVIELITNLLHERRRSSASTAASGCHRQVETPDDASAMPGRRPGRVRPDTRFFLAELRGVETPDPTLPWNRHNPRTGKTRVFWPVGAVEE